MTTKLIALDWGTSSLRAYRMGGDGVVLEVRRSAHGILKLPGGGFSEALTNLTGDWLEDAPQAAIIASGMVGARQGWREAAYLPCPAALDDLSDTLCVVTSEGGRQLHIVPGVALDVDGGAPDVMRGEETQVLGVADRDNATVVLPGTHSKWVKLSDGALQSFATFMTGELFALLTEHSILAASIDGDHFSEASFIDGLQRAAQVDLRHGLMHALFGVRALSLFGRLPAQAAGSYLSGLLIGAELAGARGAGLLDGESVVVILADPAIAKPYELALSQLGAVVERGPSHAAAVGLYRIALQAGLTAR
ncbi:MAG: 2-dehydro-3-deoxygalactonokinase [Chromatiales bacterium]|jgi:2-dehydro-3-deoxygalactonokinase|nr:2-dehydro-3-deoxygalactonokinase [Chromatiales bacterium]